MPGKNCFRSDDLRHRFERFPAQALGRRSQADTFGVGELNSALDLIAQDSVLGYQILVLRQEFFINRTRNIGEHSLPIHRIKLNQHTTLQATS